MELRAEVERLNETPLDQLPLQVTGFLARQLWHLR